MSELLEEAIKYAERGFYVFPCRIRPSKPFLTPKGKQKILPAKSPLYKGGLNNATTDRKQIEEWWKKTPQAAIGVNCGLSNLIVVDIDTHKKEVNGFDNWMSLNISDEGALHQATPSGGLHIAYSGITNSYGDENVAVDIRSRGSYFIIAPSYILSKNGEYKKYIALDDWSRTPVQAPCDLMEKLDILRGKNKKENRRKTIVIESLDKEVIKAKNALEKLPQEYCEEYYKWISVGLILKSLGDAGFELWNEWSKQSDKYNDEELEDRWDEFKPREIGLGSLMFWAYGSKRERET